MNKLCILIFSISQIVAVCGSINGDILEYINLRQLPSLSRTARQVPPPTFSNNHGPFSNPDLAGACNQQCADQMQKSLEVTGLKIASALKNAPAQALDAALYDTAAFKTFCTVYQTERTCMDRCGDSPLKTAMQNGFKSLDYVCIDKHDVLLSYLPCYKNATPEFVQKCSPHCGGEESFEEIQKELTESQIYFDLNHSKELLGLTCELVDCQAMCESPILEKACGTPEAATFMREFASKTMQSMVDLLSELPSELELVPESCKNVANGVYGKSSILFTPTTPKPIAEAVVKHIDGDKFSYYTYNDEEELGKYIHAEEQDSYESSPMSSDYEVNTLVAERLKQAEQENNNPWSSANSTIFSAYSTLLLMVVIVKSLLF